MDIDTNTVVEQTNPRKIPKWAKVLIILPILGVLAGAYFIWSWAFLPNDQGESGQKQVVQDQNKQYKSEKYNFGFSYPIAYEVFETVGENILDSRDSVSFTLTSATGGTGSGTRLTIAVYDWSGDLNSFVKEKIPADLQIKPQACPKKSDCLALVGSTAAKFPLQFVFKSAKGIVGVQLKNVQGELIGSGFGEPLTTILGSLSRK